MKKSTIFFLSTTMFLLGVVTGFLISPVKRGINFKNRCGNQGVPASRRFSSSGCCSSQDDEEQNAD